MTAPHYTPEQYAKAVALELRKEKRREANQRGCGCLLLLVLLAAGAFLVSRSAAPVQPLDAAHSEDTWPALVQWADESDRCFENRLGMDAVNRRQATGELTLQQAVAQGNYFLAVAGRLDCPLAPPAP
jgi:heme A synthase